MMNIGHRPTIGSNDKSLEVHLFNFNEDIYDHVISIEMISKIRDEKKFGNIEELALILHLDKKNALEKILHL